MMNAKRFLQLFTVITISLLITITTTAQIGTRFPSEKKIIKDPVTGTVLSFLTSKPMGDSKIYQTHPQWTADGEWLIFRSNRVRNEAMAVNEKTGDIVQVSEGGYTGMLCVARKSMSLYIMRYKNSKQSNDTSRRPPSGPLEIVAINLAKLFEDIKNNKLQNASAYQRVCGFIPEEYRSAGDMALDADEGFAYFKVGREEAAKHIAPGTKIEGVFGPRNMGAGPAGLMSMDLKTGELKYVVSVPFQIGHVQTNPWVKGEIIFCWETGGKSPQRTWIVNANGTGLRPLYPEADYEWVTHEAVISKDEVAIAIMGHRKINFNPSNNDTTKQVVDPKNPGQEKEWGNSGTREKPTGLGIVNLRTRQMAIAGQTPNGSGLWHVNGSADGRWAVGDDFKRNIYLIDRHTSEMILLSAGHKESAADHPHPTFNADGTKIEIQSAMLAADNRSMSICIIPVPEEWLKRVYK